MASSFSATEYLSRYHGVARFRRLEALVDRSDAPSLAAIGPALDALQRDSFATALYKRLARRFPDLKCVRLLNL